MSAIKKIHRLFSELGPIDTAIYLLTCIIPSQCKWLEVLRFDIIAQPVPAATKLPERARQNIKIRQIPNKDASLDGMPLSQENLDFRFSQDSICLGVFRSDTLIAHIWLCKDVYREDIIRCCWKFTSDNPSLWDYDAYVFPEYRLGRAFSQLWDGAFTYLRERDVQWTFSRISPFNSASVSAHRRLSALIIGKVLFVRLFQAQVMFSTHAPYFHLCGKSGQGPTFQLRKPEQY